MSDDDIPTGILLGVLAGIWAWIVIFALAIHLG